MADFPQDPAAFMRLINLPPPPGSPYSLPIPGSEVEGRSPVYRHWRFLNRPLLSVVDPKIRTAHDAFESSAKKRPYSKCLGTRAWDSKTKSYGAYEWLSYGDIATRRKNFGAGVVELHKQAGIVGKYGVGLWCQNRYEWQISDLGCMSQSLFTVSIYDTLGPEVTEYIINHASLACVITSLPHMPTLLRLALAKRIPTLKFIVCLDPLDDGEQPGNSKAALLNNLASEAGIKVHFIGDVEKLGAGRSMNPPSPDDIITINYTSGTTGNPKGVVLTHSIAIAAVASSQSFTETFYTDVLCSYLPLAHIYERVAEHGMLFTGGSIGYFHGDILGLVDDMKLLMPTVFNSVPRLYNRFGSAIRAAAYDASGIKGMMARHVIDGKIESMKTGGGNKNVFWDRIFTTKLNSNFGLQRCRGMITGSAPIDPTLLEFLRASFGTKVVEGYGLTETYAVSSCQLIGDFSTGNCGVVAPSLEACLRSVPDMEYLVTDVKPRGELMLRGNNLFKGYYKNEEETAKAMTEDGWFKTGDIAEIDSMGRIRIVDRVKNVLKLAQGEYVSPERIENVYLANTGLVSQAYVHGDSTQAFLVSIFGIDPIQFAPFASQVLGKTIRSDDVDALRAAAKDAKVRKAFWMVLEGIGKKSKFNRWERVRAVHLDLEPFTIENELLTPTLKLKRPQAAKKFRGELDRMYEEALAEETPRAKM